MTEPQQDKISIASKAALLRFAKRPGAHLQQLGIYRRGKPWDATVYGEIPRDLTLPRPVGHVQTNALTLMTTFEGKEPHHSWIRLDGGETVRDNGDGTFSLSLGKPPKDGEWTDYMHYRPSIAA